MRIRFCHVSRFPQCLTKEATKHQEIIPKNRYPDPVRNRGGIRKMIVSRWTDIGPEWKTEDIFRIREIFRENHIPFRMPFSDLFFTSVFHMPEKDKRWSIRIRKKDRPQAVILLVREGVVCRNLLISHRHKDRSPGVISYRASQEKSYHLRFPSGTSGRSYQEAHPD